MRRADQIVSGAGYRHVLVTEAKNPWVIEKSHAIQRQLPEGTILASHGPFESQTAAEKFVVARMQDRDVKEWQRGDSEFEQGAE